MFSDKILINLQALEHFCNRDLRLKAQKQVDKARNITGSASERGFNPEKTFNIWL